MLLFEISTGNSFNTEFYWEKIRRQDLLFKSEEKYMNTKEGKQQIHLSRYSCWSKYRQKQPSHISSVPAWIQTVYLKVEVVGCESSNLLMVLFCQQHICIDETSASSHLTRWLFVLAPGKSSLHAKRQPPLLLLQFCCSLLKPNGVSLVTSPSLFWFKKVKCDGL